MMMWACDHRGWKPGRAYYLTLRRFRLRCTGTTHSAATREKMSKSHSRALR